MALAAANNLTPCILELGGKCPCIVDADANLPDLCDKICAGKFMNAGQTCVAPDFLFVHKSITASLIQQMNKCVVKFFGKDLDWNENDNLTKMVH